MRAHTSLNSRSVISLEGGDTTRDIWGLRQTERNADFHPLQPRAGRADSSDVLRASSFQYMYNEPRTLEVNCTVHMLIDAQVRRPECHQIHAEYNSG